MSYSSQHLLFKMGGHMGVTAADTVEAWSAGMRLFIGPGPFTEAAKVTFLGQVQAAVRAFHVHLDTKVHGSAWLKTLTAAYIGVDGLYVGGDTQSTTKYEYATPAAGGGVQTLPYAHAMAYTLKTEKSRGPGSSGRFYIPSGLAVDSSGRWSLGQTGICVDAAKVLLDAINTAARGIWSPASAIGVFSQVGSGTFGTVLKVGVGRSPDSQRRRDNKLKEEHFYKNLGSAAAVQGDLDERVYN